MGTERFSSRLLLGLTGVVNGAYKGLSDETVDLAHHTHIHREISVSVTAQTKSSTSIYPLVDLNPTVPPPQPTP